MKFKDYIFLAKLDLQAKKSYKGIIRSLVLSQVLIILFVFLFLSISKNVTSHLNSYSEFKNFQLQTTHLQSDSLSDSFINTSYLPDIKNTKGLTDMIAYKNYNTTNISSINVGENKYATSQLDFSIIEMEETNNVFTKLDYNTISEPLICGSTFSKNSQKELMISNLLLQSLGIEPSESIGKTITIKAKYIGTNSKVSYNSIETDDNIVSDYERIEYTLLSDFLIVGVFDSKIYSINNQSRKGEENCYFWVTTESIASEENINYPITVPYESFNGAYSHYYYKSKPEILEARALKDSYVYLPLGLGTSITSSKCDHPMDLKCYLYYDNFKDAYNAYNSLCHLMQKSNTQNDYTPKGYQINWHMADIAAYYPIYSTVVIILGLFGIIIFIMNFANLLNTIYHEMIEKRHYYAMIRAMGMENNNIRFIYLVKSFLIHIKSFIISFVISLVLAICLKFYIEDNFDIEIKNFDLNLNFGFYFSALVIVNLFILALHLLLSFCLSHKLTKDRVVDVINDKQ